MKPSDVYVRARASGRLWNSVLMVLDALIVLIATILAYEVRFEGQIPMEFTHWIPPVAVISIVVYGLLFAIFDLYILVLRYVSLGTMLRLLSAVATGFLLLSALDFAIGLQRGLRPVPFGVLFIQALLVLIGAGTIRLAGRLAQFFKAGRAPGGRRVLIVGAGSGASLLLHEIQRRPELGLHVVGMLDDDRALKGKLMDGTPILGATSSLAEVVEKKQVDEVIVAMPSAPRETIRRILNASADTGVQTRIVPAIVVQRGSVDIHDLRSVDVEDLLGREPAPIDLEEVRASLAGRVVAVTGAAGSIGSELCRQIVKLGPERLVLLDIDETRLYELSLELEGVAPGVSVPCICDIRDADSVNHVLAQHRPAVVLHAAAYKHVPMMELWPLEAIKTNVLGTLNVVRACETFGAERFVLISTDKAVAPVNVMGLTKHLAEHVMRDAARRGKVLPVAVRFGNVLGSRGSVVPIFENQLRHGGPLTVTDEGVTRYFMTIPEASRLVLQAQAIGESGDIFVLEMGEPVRIVDLARKMIALAGVPADIEFVGLRPGEKLHESLVQAHEQLTPSGRDKILRVQRLSEQEAVEFAEIDELHQLIVAGDATALTAALRDLEGRIQRRLHEAARDQS